ncbi:hypothetical protein, partial [Limnobacter sp. MED105]|uniref:hypothetical protein n=1 Tax=Limnobacter sp. MED105 TaxID=391597 RepID=UPI000156CEE2
GSTTGYTGLDNDVAAQLAILTSNDVVNSYGEQIILAVDATDDNLAVLTWPNVEGDQCSDIALAVANGVTTVDGLGDPQTVTNGQLTLDQTTLICGDGTAAVDLVMTFGRR